MGECWFAMSDAFGRIRFDEGSNTWLRPRIVQIVILLICLGVGAETSVLLGQDANWDLKNYHLYLGYAALNGHFGTDLLNLQTYLNPTLDIPFAWLALGPLSNHPWALAAVMGLWYGGLITLVWMLACGHYASWEGSRRNAAIASAAVLASTGTATISQVGTDFQRNATQHPCPCWAPRSSEIGQDRAIRRQR